ncbi:hypothetical protein PG996_005303 [Apiospora saccharicola]|uniref:Rhodopsin domain-containing protein n=1 Tax=Apiospora saccharicola TaxID=335842 RepID=A0ABR1VL55_9PEZI
MLKVTPFVDGNQPTMVAGAAVLTVLPTCAVGLRIWARRTCNQRLRWSDFWIVANIVVLVAFWVIYIIRQANTRPIIWFRHVLPQALYAVIVVCGTVAITATTAVYFPPDYMCSIDVADAEYWKFEFTTYFNYVYPLVLDVAIFAVPIWQLYPLKVKHRKKVGVMIAFGLGFG